MVKMNKGFWKLPDDETTRQFVNKKLTEEADAYEERLTAEESLKKVKATPEMFEDIMRRVRAADAEREISAARHISASEAGTEYDTAEETGSISGCDREALEIGRKVLKRRKYRKIWRGTGIAAALLALIFGLSVSTEAGRFRVSRFWSLLVGREMVIRVETDDVEEIAVSTYDEEQAWSEIEEKTGMVPVKFLYKPKGMMFQNFECNEINKVAHLFYTYENTVIKILMTEENGNKSLKSEMHYDGAQTGEIPVVTRYGTYTVIETADEEGNNYWVSFEKDDCNYSIYGAIPREEFLKMIEKIFF